MRILQESLYLAHRFGYNTFRVCWYLWKGLLSPCWMRIQRNGESPPLIDNASGSGHLWCPAPSMRWVLTQGWKRVLKIVNTFDGGVSAYDDLWIVSWLIRVQGFPPVL